MIAECSDRSPSTSFEIVDAETREDLVSRREVKYAIENVDVGKLRQLLDGNCNRLVHNHPVSRVRSIYFDDAQLSACRANLNGLSARRKFRIRWYDTLQPQNDFFFEIMDWSLGVPIFGLQLLTALGLRWLTGWF